MANVIDKTVETYLFQQFYYYYIYVHHNMGRLRDLAVACWTTDHYYPGLNLGVGISEGCFIFDFASLALEVARPI